MIEIVLERKAGDFGFEATDANGHTMRLDAGKDFGGSDFGVSPMQSLLMAMGGCSGIDIVSILKKQRQVIVGFKMKIEGEREEGKEPTVWKTANILFELEGDIEKEKAKKACLLSMEKYCSVAEILRRAGCTINWQVKVNGLS